MTFTSWQFAGFVAIVFVGYYLPPLRSLQVYTLVLASLFFYGYGQAELLPMLAVAVLGTYLFSDPGMAGSRDLAPGSRHFHRDHRCRQWPW